MPKDDNSSAALTKNKLGESKSGWRKTLDHPLSAVIVGFLLTGLVGTWLTNYYSQKQKSLEERRQEYQDSTKAVQEISKLIYTRYTRAMMLKSALSRKADIAEIKERKRLYDDVFVEWNSNLQSNMLWIRKLIHQTRYSRFEDAVEFRLVPLFREVDQSLTRAYDRRRLNKDANIEPELSAATEQIGSVLDCCYAVTDELFSFVSAQNGAAAGQESLEEKAMKEIDNRCGPSKKLKDFSK